MDATLVMINSLEYNTLETQHTIIYTYTFIKGLQKYNRLAYEKIIILRIQTPH